ncbi:MAG: Rrf2 family transcriptional regulator [Planctomycetes bacterium]|nr:Rrf2 family transcriptional regulator [Planctomycetota bacterium]MBL7106265.1 Rrf2 family transcriptional regulator [Phycisphaerae bacterium]
MRLSTKTKYGIRSLCELAENYGKGLVQVRAIAQKQQVSAKYLEHLMAMLKSAGFIRSIRGSKGGYELTRSPEKIKLSDCFATLEGDFIPADCFEDLIGCKRADECRIKNFLHELQNAVYSVIDSKTLADLINDRKQTKNISYQI